MQTFHEQLLETSGVIADTLGTVFDSFEAGLKVFGIMLKLDQMRNISLTAIMRAEVLAATHEYESYNVSSVQIDALRRCVDLAQKVVRTVSLSDAKDSSVPFGSSRPDQVAKLISDSLVNERPVLSALQQLVKARDLCNALVSTLKNDIAESIWNMVDRELEIRKLSREGKEDLRQLKEDTSAFAFEKAFQCHREEMRCLYMLVADLHDEVVETITQSEDGKSVAAVAKFMVVSNGSLNRFCSRVHKDLLPLPCYRNNFKDPAVYDVTFVIFLGIILVMILLFCFLGYKWHAH